MNSSRPHVIYLHSHDTGRYIQPYGFAVETPNLQRLAEEGVLFRKAFCGNPTCSPSRACLLTGMWAHSNGMLALSHRGGRLNDYGQHMAASFNAAGYRTVRVGAQHVINGNLKPPYQQVLGDDDGNAEMATAAAEAFIASEHDRPFFLACGYGLTHRTQHDSDSLQWHCGNDSPLGDPRYCQPPSPLPDTPETRRDFADFKIAAKRLDSFMGRVVAAVDRAGLREKTLIICTTDHGIAFPHMKCNLTDHGIGVMLIVRGPGGFTGGKCIPAMVSHLDIYPTLCELCGLERPEWLQGSSMLPLVDGSRESLHEAIFAEVNFHAAYEPQRCVRTERFKYIRRLEPRKHPVLTNCDDSISKQFLVAHGWRQRPQQSEYLFDLMLDPNEAANLVGDPDYAERLEEMRQRLDNWMKKTQDPFISGTIPPLPNTIVNPATGYSPGATGEQQVLNPNPR